MFPSVHFSETLNEYLIDTPGFLGVDEQELKIAKEQSIRLILQRASRVKIVVLVDCKDLDGIQDITRTFVEILGNFHINDMDNTPIYVLFNKLKLNEGQGQKYYSLTDEEKSKFIIQNVLNKLKRAANALIEHCKRLSKRLETTRRGLEESGMGDKEIWSQLQNDANFHDMVKSAMTFRYLKNALESNYWGYFDPTNTRSIEQTVQGIRGARSVDSNAFDFTMYQNEWVLAKRYLEEKLLEYKEWLVVTKMNKQHPQAFFEHCYSALDKFISESHNELNDWKHKRNAKSLTEKYNKEMSLQIKSTEKKLSVMREKVDNLSEERKTMGNKTVVVYEDKWNKEGTFSDYGTYTVKYPYSKAQGYPVDIPIINRDIHLSESTHMGKDEYYPEKSVSVTEFYSVSA